MKRIDFEHHFITPELLNYFSSKAGDVHYDPSTTVMALGDGLGVRLDKLYFDITDISEKRLAAMDMYQIDTAVLSSTPITEIIPGSEAIALCKGVNDRLYEATRNFPGRFIGTAGLPVGDVNAAVDELTRCSQELGFPVWHTHSNYGPGRHLDDPRCRPLLAKAAELKMAVYLHPTLPTDKRFTESGFAFAGAGLGFTVDTLTTTLKLIISGIFDEYPDLTLVMGHLGEAMPFLLERMDNRFAYFKDEHLKNEHDISYYFKNKRIFVTTSGNMSKEAFDCAKNVLGMDTILFATDFPYENPKEVVAFFDSLALSEQERGKLFADNFEKYILGLK